MPLKPEPIGLRPDNDPFNEQVRRCFTQAGFTDIRLALNEDMSMLTFWLKRGTHPPFGSRRQAHAALLRMLRDGGVNLGPHDLAVAVDGDFIDGALTPPDYPTAPV